MDNVLVFLRVVSPLIALIAGISGIIGQSTDNNGQLTYYGWGTLIALIVSSIVAVITTLVEQKKEKEKERVEQEKEKVKERNELVAINKNLLAQSKILDDLSRSFYRIETVDLSIEYFISADHPWLVSYRQKLDAFLVNWMAEGRPIINESERTTVIENHNHKPGEHPIYALSMKPLAPLLPSRNNEYRDAFGLFSITADVIVGNRIDFSLLDNIPKNQVHLPDLYINNFCDFKTFAPTLFDKRKSVSRECILSYYPADKLFRVLTRVTNSYITYNNGSVLSFKDVIGRYLTVFLGRAPTEFSGIVNLGEVRVNFNRSKAKDYSSWVHVKGDDMIKQKGKYWQSFSCKVTQGFAA